MKITIKFMGLFSVIVCLFLTALVLNIFIERRRFEDFSKKQKAFQQQNFEKIVGLIGKPLETLAFDYTWWNEMVDFVKTADLSWAELNLDSSFETFQVTDHWTYNNDLSLVYSGNDREDDSLKDLPVPLGIIPQLFAEGAFRHFFVYTPLGLMEIRGATITTDDDIERLKAPEGYFFAGRLWTEQHVEEIASVTNSSIRILPFTENMLIKESDSVGITISFRKPLMGWDGAPVAVMAVQSDVAGFQKFNEAARQLLAVFIVFIGTSLVLIVIFSRILVTKPLESIVKALSTQDPASIESLSKDKEEFGKIARLVKEFFIQKNDLVAEIADRKRIEENLRHEKNFTELIIGSMPGLFYIFEQKSGRFIRRNDNWIIVTRYNDTELESMTAVDFFAEGEDRDKAMKGFEKAYKDGYNTMENDLLTKNGRKIPYFFTGRKISVYGKTYLAGMAFDISDRKKAEEEKVMFERQLLQSQKMESIGTMANGIAHNFNNIFGSIRGLVEMAIDDVPRGSRTKNDLQRAIQSIEEAKELSDKMLTFSRKYESDYRPIQLSSVIKDAFYLFKMSISASAKVNDDIDLQCPPVLANANEIRQVVMNLCNNAYASLDGGGGTTTLSFHQVHIDAAMASEHEKLKEGHYAKLTVKDTGRGMDAETREHIFEPFFTTKKIGEGTGLGLSVVHGIVMNHQGSITVDSQPGKGTEFSIFFPVAEI